MTSQEARERLEAMASGVSFDDRDEMDMFRQILKDIAELEAALAAERQRREAAEAEAARTLELLKTDGQTKQAIRERDAAIQARDIAAETAAEAARRLEQAELREYCQFCGSRCGHDANCPLLIVHMTEVEKHPEKLKCQYAIKLKQAEHARDQAQADAAAMREALRLLPDGRAGSKTGRADYGAIVGGDVLLKCWKAAQGNAGQPLLDELARLREALEPFAEYAGILDDAGAPDCCPIRTDPMSVAGGRPKASDCRAARAALSPSLTPEQRAAKQAWLDDDDMPLKGGD